MSDVPTAKGPEQSRLSRAPFAWEQDFFRSPLNRPQYVLNAMDQGTISRHLRWPVLGVAVEGLSSKNKVATGVGKRYSSSTP